MYGTMLYWPGRSGSTIVTIPVPMMLALALTHGTYEVTGTASNKAVLAVDGPFARSPGVKLEVYAMLPSSTRAAWTLRAGGAAVGLGTPPIVNG